MPCAANPDDAVRIYYKDIGSGPPLALLHGLSQSSDTWHRFGYVDALKDQYRLLLIDARAHGKSEGPHDAESYATPRMVSDIVGVLDDAGVGRTLYYGYSMGGRLGFGLGIFAPERVAALAVGGAYPLNRRPPGLEARISILKQGTEAYINHLGGLYGEGLNEAWRRELEAYDPLGLAALMEANLAEPGLEDEVRQLTMPVLIVTGEQDPSVYEQATEAADYIPDATLVVLRSLGHLEAFERSDLALPHLRRFFGNAITGGQ